MRQEVNFKHYSEAAMERVMKVPEIILRAIAKRIRWLAETSG
jgi:hypothetical protein